MDSDIRIECSQLDDFEIEDMMRFLEADALLNDVVSAPIKSEVSHQGEIELQASAAPFFVLVKFAHDHWKTLGAVGLGVKQTVDAIGSVQKRLEKWSDQRANRYEFRVIYDSNGDVASTIKIRKKPQPR